MKVLSLFDGMSCGQIALDKLGFKVGNYFASEIDKHAIKVTQDNYPNTVQIGDVRNVKASDLPKIDLLLAGSPCQGFSFAGKQLAFDDPRSKLFFEFVRIWKEVRAVNPNAKFLLENVRMKREHELVISKYMGVEPIQINSALVSAQNRVRLYWTNIANEPYGLFGDMRCTIPQPKDKGILLKDILDEEVEEKYYLSEKMIDWLTRHSEKRGTEFKRLFGNEKASCLTTTEAKQNLSNDYIDTRVPIQLNKNKESGGKQPYQQNRIYDTNGISPALLAEMSSGTHAIVTHSTQPRNGKGQGGKGHLSKNDQRSYCLDTGNSQAIEMESRIRRLTPSECEKLQTVPVGYTSSVSDTQRYRMLGNGWTIDVITHILSYYA